MTASARDRILASIGASGNPEQEYQAIERGYESAGTAQKGQKQDLFIERLTDYGAGVYRCTHLEIAATIAERLHARNAQTVAVPHDIPVDWLPQPFEFIRDHASPYPQIECCDGVITGCAVAIADTGTIILDGGSSQGRRALTLLPDYHLCVAFEDQIVETVPEAMHRLAEAMSRPLTLISGPSATADIEMTRIQGVHGPRSMEVVLVSL